MGERQIEIDRSIERYREGGERERESEKEGEREREKSSLNDKREKTPRHSQCSFLEVQIINQF